MNVRAHILLMGLLMLASPVARAELSAGSPAPAISIPAALGGKDITFNLAEALTKGPVVVYFYPKSFTSVCTEEARLFAEATDEFGALGASVIGISTDTIETQREFSRLECRDKFPVAADPDGTVVRAYDAARGGANRIFASRTSYVITPNGKIHAAHTASDADSHIRFALAAIRAWKAGN